MTPDRLVAHQLASRLKRVKNKIATLTAEAEMIERMLADAAKFVSVPRLKLRSNSKGKWTVRGQVRSYLTDQSEIAKAQEIYVHLIRYDPTLNPSTFRSHLKRMIADGIIERGEKRGYYRLAKSHEAEAKENNPQKLRRVTIRPRYV